jgi:phage terminase small subunit
MEEQTPPNHLSKATAEWWSFVMADYALEPHHIQLLTLACEAYDSAQQAGEVLQHEGKIFIDRFDQPKPRPEVAIQRDSAIGFARMLRELDLDIAAPTDRSRPHSLLSNRGL